MFTGIVAVACLHKISTPPYMNKLILSIVLAIFLGSFGEANGQACGSRQLDPRIANFLKFIGYKDFSLEELRKMPIEQIKFAGPPPIPYPKEDVKRIKVTKDSIPVLVFNPTHGKNLPVVINYHGGGFISPLIVGLEHMFWREAKDLNAVLFAVDYRVAPEHKYPAAVNDSYNAFKWIAEHAGEYDGDTGKIVLMGNSAGANLVAVVSQKAKQESKFANRIKLQVMNGLPADLRPENMETSESYQQNATGYFQTKDACYFSVELYAPGETNNPEVSPIITNDFSGLPPAVIINAEFDPLRDDGFRYAEKLRKAGVTVWDKCFAGQIHCLIGVQPDYAEYREYMSTITNAMAQVFK